MDRRLAIAQALVFVALAACSRAAPAPSGDAVQNVAAEPQRAEVTKAAPLDKKKFGAEITEKTTTTLDDIAREPTRFASKTVRTEGRVSAVCEHAGCWMDIADDKSNAHIKMAGHSFFVPRTSAGHHAVVQGKVIAEDKDHCTEEAEQQTGHVAKLEIEANGVEFVD